MRYNLKKTEILRGSNLLRCIFKTGEQFKSKYLKCYVLKCPDCPQDKNFEVSVAFVVPKAVKLAVDRNRLKRLMRESYRRHKSSLICFSRDYSVSIKIVFLFLSQSQSQRKFPEFTDIESEVKNLIMSITGYCD